MRVGSVAVDGASSDPERWHLHNGDVSPSCVTRRTDFIARVSAPLLRGRPRSCKFRASVGVRVAGTSPVRTARRALLVLAAISHSSQRGRRAISKEDRSLQASFGMSAVLRRRSSRSSGGRGKYSGPLSVGCRGATRPAARCRSRAGEPGSAPRLPRGRARSPLRPRRLPRRLRHRPDVAQRPRALVLRDAGAAGPTRIEALPLKLEYCHTCRAAGDDAAWIRRRFRDACARLGSEAHEEEGRLVVEWGSEPGSVRSG